MKKKQKESELKPMKTTFKQLLKAAKKAEKVLNRKWAFYPDGVAMRLPNPDYNPNYLISVWNYCPFTAAALVLTGKNMRSQDWDMAAEAIGYIGNASKVVEAADGWSHLGPRERWMRAQMKKELKPRYNI